MPLPKVATLASAGAIDPTGAMVAGISDLEHRRRSTVHQIEATSLVADCAAEAAPSGAGGSQASGIASGLFVLELQQFRTTAEVSTIVNRLGRRAIFMYFVTPRCCQLIDELSGLGVDANLCPTVGSLLAPFFTAVTTSDPRCAVPLREVVEFVLGASVRPSSRCRAIVHASVYIAAWSRWSKSDRHRPAQLLAVAVGMSDTTLRRHCQRAFSDSPLHMVHRATVGWLYALVTRGLTMKAAGRAIELRLPESASGLVKRTLGVPMRSLASRRTPRPSSSRDFAVVEVY